MGGQINSNIGGQREIRKEENISFISSLFISLFCCVIIIHRERVKTFQKYN